MLKRLKTSLFGRGQSVVAVTQQPAIATPSATLPGGFQPTQSADTLLSSEYRRRCLQQAAQTISMPAALYGTLCSQPLGTLLHRVQQVPAAAHGPWARQGGFGDLTLQYTACAVRLAKGAMFPPGAAPEEQSAQSAAWNAVVFWAALFHHLPLLARFEGEQLNGEPWLPGMTVPERAWRCRFSKSEPAGADASAQASLMAAQLLPAEAVKWLAGTPAALHNLAGALWNGHPEMSLIRDILKQAAKKVDAPSMAAGTLSSPVASLPAVSPLIPVSAVVPATAGTPPPSDDVAAVSVDILLSELASPIAADPAPASMAADEVPVVEEDISVAMPTPVDDTPDSSGETDMLLSLFSMVAEDDKPTATAVDDSPEIVDTPEAVGFPVDEALPAAAPPVPAIDSVETVAQDSGAPSLPDIPDSTYAPVGVADETVLSAQECVADSPGSRFFSWLKDVLLLGGVSLNTPESKVHIVSGFVFIAVPDIFFAFIEAGAGEASQDREDRRAIQASFERLGKHRVRGKDRFIRCRIFTSDARTGKYRQLNGYLIKAATIYKGGQIPEDSPYILFQ
jgi:integrating conjugative element relaxase (TIGR03760 family)